MIIVFLLLYIDETKIKIINLNKAFIFVLYVSAFTCY